MRTTRKQVKIGVVRTFTTDNDEVLKAHGRIIEKHFPNVRTKSLCIEDQPEGVFSRETAKKGAPKVVRAVRKLALERPDAIVISCCGDPGLEDARKAVKIPVIGAGRAAACLALQAGDKIGVFAQNKLGGSARAVRNVLGKRFVAVGFPSGVTDAYDIMNPRNRMAILKAAERLGRSGVDVVVLSCTGYSTIRLAASLRKRLRIPVIDPVIASASMALSLIHSQI